MSARVSHSDQLMLVHSCLPMNVDSAVVLLHCRCVVTVDAFVGMLLVLLLLLCYHCCVAIVLALLMCCHCFKLINVNRADWQNIPPWAGSGMQAQRGR